MNTSMGVRVLPHRISHDVRLKIPNKLTPCIDCRMMPPLRMVLQSKARRDSRRLLTFSAAQVIDWEPTLAAMLEQCVNASRDLVVGQLIWGDVSSCWHLLAQTSIPSLLED